jgi:hypothetical protein
MRFSTRTALICLVSWGVILAQSEGPVPAPATESRSSGAGKGWPAADQLQQSQQAGPQQKSYRLEPGTHIPLTLINSVTSRNATEGERVYLETAYPVVVNSRIVVPAGSYVMGTVTQVKRAGRVKGKGEIYVRFDSMTLPNGTTRDFRARISQVDDLSSQKLDKAEGKVTGEGNKGGDMRTIGEAAGAGASVGSIAGAVGGHTGAGLGIGAAAGAAAGLVGVLVTRGPEAVLARGTTIEMVLDRTVEFSEAEIDFGSHAGGANRPVIVPASNKSDSRSTVGRRFPW